MTSSRFKNIKAGMKEAIEFSSRNPIAKSLKSPHLKPKKINSKKVYKRKPKHKSNDT